MKTSFHRLLRSVMVAAALAAGVAGPLRTAFGAQTSAETLTTIYVNKYFEVREHEAPTKYVFKGNKRNAFRNALRAATDAAGKVTDASDKDLATRAVRAYGAEKQAGVTVGELGPARKGVVGGHTHIHWSGRGRKVASAGDVTLDFSVPSGSLTHTVAHEGSHAAAGQEYAAALQQSHKAAKANPDVNITDYEFERRGYTVESIIAQALNESALDKGKRGEGMVIWDKSWKDFKTQRAAPIDQVVLKKYGTSPQNPGGRME